MFFAFRGFKQCQNNKWDVTSAYGFKWRIPRELQMCTWSQSLNKSTNVAYVTQLSHVLIIQPNIFKYIDGIRKKFTPDLSIDKEISLGGNRMLLFGAIYHEGVQSYC